MAKKSTKTTKNSKKNTIFIQIASYRDPQLLPTLRDCVKNADNPENLVFGLCWQRDSNESLEEFTNQPNVKVIDVPYKESKGACWARNKIQQLYNGEKYTLQLDSHHRFAKGWDTLCINMIKELQADGFKKPLLTGYIPSFDPDDDPGARVQEPWKMDFDRFIPEGAVFFLPATIDDWRTRTKPMPARFYSAHFCFTLGEFSVEVQHDPEYYFHGEEISIAVRAYTHGYDLFHPHKIVAWHEYTRKGRSKHWDDVPKWGEYNNNCHARNRKLFEMDGEKRDIDFGKYGFGNVRSLRDYEKYAGLHFKKRAIQQQTLDRLPPPNNDISYSNDEEWEKSFLNIFKHCIDIGYSQVPENDYDFWAVIFKDENDKEIYRRDAVPEEIERMKNDPDGYCKVWREFNTEVKPAKWIVWPHSKSKGWCEVITGNL
jgi:glycosyltransferase involved in cell wall biosynthesis